MYFFTAGFKFYRSANNVILCSGNEEGFLPSEYFLKAVDKKTGMTTNKKCEDQIYTTVTISHFIPSRKLGLYVV